MTEEQRKSKIEQYKLYQYQLEFYRDQLQHILSGTISNIEAVRQQLRNLGYQASTASGV